MSVQDDELAELRQRVDCRTVLEQAGWQLDAKESTRRAPKYRQGAGRIVIVTHDGRGWFDPLNDKRGDVLGLAQYVWGGNLGHARKHLRPLAGLAPPKHETADAAPIDADEMWRQARQLRPGSQGWTYLAEVRGLPVASIQRALQAGVLREGVYGTVWAMHRGAPDQITGWEMRGPNYKGFSKGGTKTVFWIGHPAGTDRVAVTESAIDALSLASLEGWPAGTLYVSTGGGYGPQTQEALRALLPVNARLVAATDQGTGGELLASRLHELAMACGADFARLRPTAKDWNDQLRLGHAAPPSLPEEIPPAAPKPSDRAGHLHSANPAQSASPKKEAIAELSPDARRVLSALLDRIDRHMAKLSIEAKAELRAFAATELLKKERAEGPVVLSAGQQPATAPEPERREQLASRPCHGEPGSTQRSLSR